MEYCKVCHWLGGKCRLQPQLQVAMSYEEEDSDNNIGKGV